MHTIRLRGPWSAASGDPSSSLKFDWDKGILDVLARANGGSCCLSRQFNLPTGLGLGDEVRVTTSGLAVKTIRLNGELIGAGDITQHLRPRNTLEIVCSGSDGSLPEGELPIVQLEIHDKS